MEELQIESICGYRVAAFSPDGRFAIFGSQFKDLRYVELPPKSWVTKDIPRGGHDLTQLLVSGNSEKIAAVSERMVEVWHIDAIGSPSFKFKLKHVRGAMTAAFSPDSQFIAIGISDTSFELKGLKTLYVLPSDPRRADRSVQ